MDRQTDRQMDRQGQILMPPTIVTGGIKKPRRINPKSAELNCSRQHFNLFFFLFFQENKACLTKDSHEILSLIFSEKKAMKSIHECHLLQWWLALLGLISFP